MLNFTIALLFAAAAIIAFLLIPAAIGTLVLFHTLIRPKKAPADRSNRIGHLRLVWFALKHEDRFAELYEVVGRLAYRRAFPWLRMDEREAVDHDHDGR